VLIVWSKVIRILVGSTLSALACATLVAQPVCNHDSSAAAALARLRAAMAHGRFIAYQPTSLQVVNGRPRQADAASIRADLALLRPRFDSLITYGAAHGAEAIPTIAASFGFRAVIVGVWNPFDAAELHAALAAAKDNPTLVAGLSLGNEMVFGRRTGFAELAALIAQVHVQAPRVPISTTEPFHMFYDRAASPLLGRLDFLLVNVHPIFQPWFRNAPDGNAAQFVVNVLAKLSDTYCGPILVKETGVPTAPQEAGYTEQRQSSFYGELRRRLPPSGTQAFAYFSAFDAPWRVRDANPIPGEHPAEAHWGLYDAQRRPKAVVAQLPLLNAPAP